MNTWAEKCTRLGVACVLFLAACSASPDKRASTFVSERIMLGDTAVVRTISGSVWADTAYLTAEQTIGVLDGDERYVFGRIAALAVDNTGRILATDAQAQTLRVFSADGTLLKELGREGAGPGEFRGLDAGLAVLSDGRIVVRDPGNARLQVFSADGEAVATWAVISGQWRSREPLYATGDTLLTLQPGGAISDINNVAQALVRIGPDGRVVDTLALPTSGDRASQLTARRGNNNASLPVPWTPTEQWTWHPDGYFVFAQTGEYRITVLRPDGVRRIEREVTPQRVADGERAQEEARATAGMRWLDPAWQWNGAPIPRDKPAFQQLFVAQDGRLWVLRQGPQRERSTVERDENDVELRYDEVRYFDVFETNGDFMGSVRVPDAMQMQPAPVFSTTHVWAVTLGESGEQRITRYTLQGVR